VTKEGDCAWCAAGKYQTGVGLVAGANCTWCVAGKYQSGTGLDIEPEREKEEDGEKEREREKIEESK
jgi:hypothetical protein